MLMNILRILDVVRMSSQKNAQRRSREKFRSPSDHLIQWRIHHTSFHDFWKSLNNFNKSLYILKIFIVIIHNLFKLN